MATEILNYYHLILNYHLIIIMRIVVPFTEKKCCKRVTWCTVTNPKAECALPQSKTPTARSAFHGCRSAKGDCLTDQKLFLSYLAGCKNGCQSKRLEGSPEVHHHDSIGGVSQQLKSVVGQVKMINVTVAPKLLNLDAILHLKR